MQIGKATEKLSDPQKLFGRSYTDQIEERKRAREAGFQPREVHNKVTLAVFVVVFLGMLGIVVYGASQGAFSALAFHVKVGGQELHAPRSLLLNAQWTGMLMAGLAAGAVWPLLFLFLLAAFPTAVTWFSCMLFPTLMAGGGLVLIAVGNPAGGCILLGIAAIIFAFNYYIRKKINFTATLVRGATRLTTGHPSVLLVGLAHALGSLAWLLLCCAVAVVLANTFGIRIKVAILIVALPMFWGALVFHYAYFVVAAGVMARWYFGEAVSVSAAVSSAWVYCLGCICFGALLLALVKLVQVLAEAATHDENHNPNCLYFVCSPVLDIIETLVVIFNRFAFAIIAIYNMSFQLSGYEAIRLLRANGLTAIAQDFVLGYVGLVATLTSTAASLALLAPLTGTSFLGVLPHGAVLGRHLPAGMNPGVMDAATAQTELWAMEVVCLGVVFSMVLDGMVQSCLEGMTTALLVCFAESPEQLKVADPELHARLSERASLVPPTEKGAEHASVVTVV